MLTAVLVDGDQQVSGALADILRTLETTSELVERRAYGAGLGPWRQFFAGMGFTISRLPPPVDSAIMVDAMDLVHARPELMHYCIVTGDHDFTPLVAKLQERGKRVTGIAQGRAAGALRAACDEFLSLDHFSGSSSAMAAVPRITTAILEMAGADGWVDHNLLSARLTQQGFDPRTFGKSRLIDIIGAIPDEYEVRPTPRSAGPVAIRLRKPIEQ